MSKNSNHQRLQTLKEWDKWMENKHPQYKERKKRKPKRSNIPFIDDDEVDFSQYGV